MAVIPTLGGNDVILSGHRPEDAAAQVAGEDEETARRFGWWPKRSTEDGVLATYECWAAHWRDDDPVRPFAVRASATDALIGGCELRIQPDGSGEVSYWIHADQRGKAYAQQAVALLIDYARSIGVTRLAAHVALDNYASRRVAEKSGFAETGIINEEGEQRMRYVSGQGTSC
jgi:RimJ/RimL family protein N-acetyltransferase